jgi:hypothetical protein
VATTAWSLFGGGGNDTIDAANDESPGGRDDVNCGPGEDEAIVNGADAIRDNCETVSFRR